jgi:hypothetical protein
MFVNDSDGSKFDSRGNYRLNSGSASYHSIQNLFSSHNLSICLKFKTYKTTILTLVFYGSGIWSLTSRKEYTLRAFGKRLVSRLSKL